MVNRSTTMAKLCEKSWKLLTVGNNVQGLISGLQYCVQTSDLCWLGTARINPSFTLKTTSELHVRNKFCQRNHCIVAVNTFAMQQATPLQLSKLQQLNPRAFNAICDLSTKRHRHESAIVLRVQCSRRTFTMQVILLLLLVSGLYSNCSLSKSHLDNGKVKKQT